MERHWDTASNHEQSALADEAVLALRQSFCDYLVSARKQRNMGIHEIAGVTRIPVRSLERLESGLFEELPADVFVRGFLRSYARCVGLDVEETIRRYTACGMTPAPVASPMADKLASSMATLHEGGHPSVRQVTAPLPVQADDGIGTSPGPQAQLAGRPGRSITEALIDAAIEAEAAMQADTAARRALTAPGHEAAAPVAANERASQQHAEKPASSPEPLHAQGSARLSGQVSSLGLGSPASHDEQPLDERPARRKRRRRRRQRREIADAAPPASAITPGAPDAHSADVDAAPTSDASQAPVEPALSADALVDGSAGEAAANARGQMSAVAPIVASVAAVGEAPRLRAETMRDTTAQAGKAATAAEHAAARPFTSLPRASTQSARTPRGRAATVTARPVLVIDDAHPEEAERAQEERVERHDSSWRSLLPPALLDSDDGSHRGTLTLAVIILVIVATLTMSYLLRRPNISGDGVTWNAPTALDEHRLA